MDTKTKYYSLGGGLDVVTAAIEIDPGFAIAMQNYEPWFNGGYRRIDGFERFDGHPKPSEQTFIGFNVSTAVGLILGGVVTGVTSGATGKISGIYLDDGTFGHDVIGVTKVAGTFVNGESVNVGAFTITSAPIIRYTPTIAASGDLEQMWLLQAQNYYRADILVVPGSGDVRGAWQRKTNVYAIRDNAGATAGILHKASAAGWTTTGITMTRYIYFATGGGGTAQPLPAEGTAVNGQTSGATATIHRVITHGGATATNDAFGYFVLRSVTGTFSNGENLRVGVTTFAISGSASVAFAFPPGGNYRFKNHNFFGGSSTYRTYGVNKVGPAFEIDENNFVTPILLPMSPITGQPPSNSPYLIEEHLNNLFLAFPGGSLVQSVVGEPLLINGFLGAAEFGLGSEITGLNSVTGGVLAISTEQDVRGLFGNNITDWVLKVVGEKKGDQLYSPRRIDTVYSLDSVGISSLSRTQSFGDFVAATISQRVQPIVQARRALFTDATIVRNSNQYRLYFSDGSGLIMYVPQSGATDQTLGGGQKAVTQFGLLRYPIVFRKVYNTEDENGLERTYICTTGGFVYEDQKGTNFDGAVINSYIRLAFNHLGTPAYRKHFRRAVLELNSHHPLLLKYLHDLSFGSTESQTGQIDISVSAGGGLWDTDNWDECLWDSDVVSSARADLGGTGENIGIVIFNSSATVQPFILQGMILHFDLRKLQR